MKEGWSSGMSRVRRAALQGVTCVSYQSVSEMRTVVHAGVVEDIRVNPMWV